MTVAEERGVVIRAEESMRESNARDGDTVVCTAKSKAELAIGEGHGQGHRFLPETCWKQ